MGAEDEEEGVLEVAKERESAMDLDMVISAIPPAPHRDSSSGSHMFFRPAEQHSIENEMSSDRGGSGRERETIITK